MLARSLPRHARVLDIGCGHGVPIAEILVAVGCRVHVLDAALSLAGWQTGASRMSETGTPFQHSTPTLYDRYMGPLLFEPCAEVLAERAALLQPDSILETAAGSGIATRALHKAIPLAHIVVTDINPVMLEAAAQRLASDRVSFRPADAQHLPFADESFDLVVCQFGVMFFPNRARAHEEARRVLRSQGHYLFVTFDRLQRNPVPAAAGHAVDALFPGDPPAYMARGPFSYADRSLIEHDLVAAGFTRIELETVVLTSRVRARDAAIGLVLGSPLRSEVERRDPSALLRALEAVTAALAPWDGSDAPMSAHIVRAAK